MNARYGGRCIGGLVLKPGRVRGATARIAAAPALPEAERRRVAAAVEGVEDDGLKNALDRLGQAVVGAEHRARTKA